MKLSSSNGTNLTIEELTNIRNTLALTFERILEINKDGIQFDFVSCPKLSNCVDSINEIMKKITDVVYQEHYSTK